LFYKAADHSWNLPPWNKIDLFFFLFLCQPAWTTSRSGLGYLYSLIQDGDRSVPLWKYFIYFGSKLAILNRTEFDHQCKNKTRVIQNMYGGAFVNGWIMNLANLSETRTSCKYFKTDPVFSDLYFFVPTDFNFWKGNFL